jgi:hypothetical protein
MFGLDVVIWEDSNKDDILSKLKKTSQEFKQEHCMLVVCVLSHGEKGIKYHDVNTIVIPNFYYT